MYLTSPTTAASKDLSPDRQVPRGGTGQVPLSKLVPDNGKHEFCLLLGKATCYHHVFGIHIYWLNNPPTWQDHSLLA